MKKLFLVGFALVASQMSFGQSTFGNLMQRLSFGVKAGGNYSNFTDASFEMEGLAGFHAGLIVNFKLADKWSIQEEFLYSTQGAKTKNSLLGVEKDVKLSYLSVPILVKYHSAIGVYAEVGPQVNMLIEDAKDTGFEKFADKIDAGVAAGVGYQFRAGSLKGLGIGARYYQGFMDVGKFNSATVKPDFKNSVFQAGVFYIF